MWLIAAECHEILDAIPVLVADPKKDGDIIKTESIADDIADTARYGLKSMLSPRGAPVEVQIEQRISDYAESRGKTVDELSHNSRLWLHRQAMAEQQAKRKRKGGRAPIFRPSRGGVS